ncbi:MAG: glycoside hydrolase [Isosphaeraceae bacterium]
MTPRRFMSFRDESVLILSVVVILLLGGSLVPVASGAEVRRSGDRWTVENARLRVEVVPEKGVLSVRDKAAPAAISYRVPFESGTPFREVRPIADGLTFEAAFWCRGRSAPTRVRLTLPDAATDPAGPADLRVEADRAERSDALEMLAFLPPLAIAGARSVPVLAVADYSNGHIYPLDLDPFPSRWHGGDRLDMPWVGVTDLASGAGYALILDTPDDAVVECKSHPFEGRKLSIPQVVWLGSRGTFDHVRAYRYRFVARGGYVALAKAYRALAREQGLLVTLAEKARANPKVAQLFGAVDVWGGSPETARQARAAGVGPLLLQGRFRPEAIREINALGDLTSEYDNYTDVLPIEAGRSLDSNHDRVPESVVLELGGQRKTAWLTYDKKTQYMKRCPALWLPAAREVIPRVLAERPFGGRFIDVTTAEGLYECADPAHPLTRRDKRRCGVELLSYVRSQGLVVGGEHGIWWAVPYVDYFEGMMSSNPYFAWPAGHLKRPKSRSETYDVEVNTWAAYDQHGIGHESRVPLWELVFHDCVISTWYWGDSSDYLIQLDPSNQERKDAFNALYGTMPMLWADRQGGWQVDRERALRTCRLVGKVHRAVATAELLSHEFVTADRAVQRSTFSNGVVVVANLGNESRDVEAGGQSHRLPRHGFVAVGPGLDVAFELVDGRPVTRVGPTDPTAKPPGSR